MRKSILFSVMAIAAAITVAVGASSFALFTDNVNTASTTITAGTVNVVHDGDASDIAAIVFSGDCTNIAVNDVCTNPFTIANVGNLEFWYSGTFTNTNSSCFTLTVTGGTSDDTSSPTISSLTISHGESNFSPDATDGLDVSKTDSFVLTVAVVDSDPCQGTSTNISLSLTATQTATPHN